VCRVSVETPVEYVYVLFEMIHVTCILVVDEGCLVGTIHRSGLIENLKAAVAKPKQV
jgi:predicted transcriptional regulator